MPSFARLGGETSFDYAQERLCPYVAVYPPLDLGTVCGYNNLGSIPDVDRLYPPGCGGALEDIVSLVPVGELRRKITVSSVRDKKLHHEPITCLTAYVYSSARLIDEAGIDIVLVGDSLAQTMLGHENTLSVTIDEMLHHTKAVRRGVKHALLVADMPFGSYQSDPIEAVRNAS